MLINKKSLAKSCLIMLFSIMFLGCFELFQEMKMHYLYLIPLVFSFLYLTPFFSRRLLFYAVILLLFNIVSQLSGLYSLGVFNFSWFVQFLLYSCLILMLSTLLKETSFSTHIKYGIFLLNCISLLMIYSSILVIFNVGFSQSLISFSGSYSRLYIVTSSTGMLKFIAPLMSVSLYLLFGRYASRTTKYLFWTSFVLFMIFIQVKTVFLGGTLISTLFLIRKLKSKQIKLSMLAVLMVCSTICIYYFIDVISTIGVMNGRYILPILLSPDYYLYPFGFGFGNYSHVMSNMLISLNYVGEFNDELISVLGLRAGEAFNTSESDILQLGISFGFVFLFLYFLFILKNSGDFIRNSYVDCGKSAVLFMLFSGFYQDYTQNNVYWILLIYIVSMQEIFTNQLRHYK